MVETRRQRAATAAAAANSSQGEADANKQPPPLPVDEEPARSDPRGHGCPVHLRRDANDAECAEDERAAESKMPDGGDPRSKIEERRADASVAGAADADDDADAARTSELRSYAVIALLALITCAAYPGAAWGRESEPTVHTVFYYGWISAISTGLGVLPLCFVAEINEYWIGVSNALAGGMMTAASYSLFLEGCTFRDDRDAALGLSAPLRTGLGAALGLLFILGTKRFLDRHEEVKLGSLSGADAKKILLIVFVMTLHSFSEGVGIGVSFGGEHGGGLGVFISASLAVHNIPEGLAVAIVLLPRKVSRATAALWCVATSLPQPLMAVPAFLFVSSFLPLLPVGLGFAGGAMVWVAFMELLLEAYEDTDAVTTGVASTAAAAVMIAMQRKIEEHA